MNGTLRERIKIQSGWKNPASAVAEGHRVFYNFVKPHRLWTVRLRLKRRVLE